jgi:hypothetical protein
MISLKYVQWSGVKYEGPVRIYASRGSAGGIAIGSEWWRIFIFSILSRPDLGLTQPVSYIMGIAVSFPGGKAERALGWPLT